MGGCLSCRAPHLPTAKLVAIEEEAGAFMREFPENVKVADILRERPGFFVCHADSMRYDEYVSPLSAEQELQVEHLYFLLPVTALRHPLPASHMAALAVKASAAMDRRSLRRNKIMPMMEEVGHHERISSFSPWRGELKGEGYNLETLERKRVDVGLKARAVRYKMQRIASGQERVNGPWRIKLPTIYEEGFHSLIDLT